MNEYIERITGVKRNEVVSVLWGLIYIISLFLSYYVLRPIRDEIGIANGVEKLPWLFTVTLFVMLIASPLFSMMVRKFSREKFISISYRFLSLNLSIFAFLFLFSNEHMNVWVGRAFFVWVSVFNLFAISIFWSFIVDIFNGDQGKRLFGILSAGATFGGLIGSIVTSLLVSRIGHFGLLIISIFFIETAVFSSKKLALVSKKTLYKKELEKNNSLGGGVFSGMIHTFKSPYLLSISAFILLYSITSTFFYYQQANIANDYFQSREERTSFFANIDIVVNLLTLFIQVFITGRLIRKFGVMFTLCALPFVSIVGFLTLASYPVISVLVLAQVVRRVFNFSLTRPTREVLFTSISREDRYKAKNFIDTVVYRGGDQVAGWGYSLLLGLGLTISQLAFIAVPVSLVWFLLSIWLSKKFDVNLSEA